MTLRDTIAMFRRSGDPYLLLRAVLPRESCLLDPAMQVHVRFRLGGPRFRQRSSTRSTPTAMWLTSALLPQESIIWSA